MIDKVLAGPQGNVNIRTTPDKADGNIIGAPANGFRVSVVGASGDWSQIAAWVKTGLLADPPDTVPWVPLLGVNCLDDFGAAHDAAARGCPILTVMGYPDGTHRQDAIDLQTQYPRTQVMYRVFWDTHMPTADEYMAAVGDGHPDIIYLPACNEGDACGQDVAGIDARFALDSAIYARLSAAGLRYAGGGFSMGTPDFTDPAVITAISAYAPLYNAGMLFAMHLYSRDISVPFDQWYGRRYQWLAQCGFDPTRRQVVCDECGVDNGQGFAGQGVSADAFQSWCDLFVLSHANPPPMFAGGCVFQYGGSSKWQAFNIASYLGTLTAEWKQYGLIIAPPPLPLYGQRDARWAAVLLGHSHTSTIGLYGCLVSSLGMLSYRTPDAANAALTAAGLMGTASCDACLNSFDVAAALPLTLVHISSRYPDTAFPQAELDQLTAHLSAGKHAVLEVKLNGNQHFVVGNTMDGASIQILDPWYSDSTGLCPRYGPSPAIALVRAALYEAKP